MSLQKLTKKAKEDHSKGIHVGVQETPARVRIRKDLEALTGVTSEVIHSRDEFYVVKVVVKPTKGVYSGGEFHFRIDLTEKYPDDGPKVRYTGPMRVYHPNIEGEELSELRLHGRPCTDWGVCVGVQREWKPNYTLCQLIISIEMLFEHPNYDDNLPGLASTAAEVLKTDPAKFEAIAKEWMKGDTHRVK